MSKKVAKKAVTKLQTPQPKPKWEFSKKILFWTMLLFCVTLVSAMAFSWEGRDTTVFVYAIPATGGILGASIVFYLNKAKIENVCKGKIEFFKFKMEAYEKNPAWARVLEQELGIIDQSLTSKVDQEIVSSVNETIEIKNY